jgi:DGQHR domain-containing protein
MNFPTISFEQPAGDFLLSAIPVVELIRISKVDPRKFDNISLETVGGIQREPSKRRINDIADYSDTVDAAFPTPVLLAISSDDCVIDGNTISIPRNEVADIVDGQHRVLGLKLSHRKEDFVIPVVFILDANEEQKALLFATINGKQTKVPASLIYDLFGVTKNRSPQKTAHEIARAMNSLDSSPWYKRLKMLGRKTPGSMESLSQGTFVKFLLRNISSDPDGDLDIIKRGSEPPSHPNCIFNEYFAKKEDANILKILLNVFGAAKQTWPDEWDDPAAYVISKTLGYTGIMLALPAMVRNGRKKGDLSIKYFRGIFSSVKSSMSAEKKSMTSDFFSASASGESEFRRMIEKEIPN